MSDVISELLYEVGELKRRMANIVHYGTIAKTEPHDEDDPNHYMYARVKIGDLLTAPLPWLTARAGDDITWWKPSLGEQVVVLSPCGDLAQGTILPSLYQRTHMPTKLKEPTPPEGEVTTTDDETEIPEDDTGIPAAQTEVPDAGTFLAQISGTTIQIDKDGGVVLTSEKTAKIESEQITLECPNNEDTTEIPKLTLVAPDIELKTNAINLVHGGGSDDDILVTSKSKIKFMTDLHVNGQLSVKKHTLVSGDVYSKVTLVEGEEGEETVGFSLSKNQHATLGAVAVQVPVEPIA